MLIAFEGIDCVGKTMAINLIHDKLESKGYSVYREREFNNSFNQCFKDIVIHDSDQLNQLFAALLARRKLIHSLECRLKEFDVVLHDRYSLSTLVYQDVLTLYPDMLNRLEQSTLPHELFYIRPTTEYDRKFFLNRRSNRNRMDDSWKQGEWLKMYDTIIENHREIAQKANVSNILEWQYVYKVDNDGTDKFQERVLQTADKITARIDAEKRMKQEHEL